MLVFVGIFVCISHSIVFLDCRLSTVDLIIKVKSTSLMGLILEGRDTSSSEIRGERNDVKMQRWKMTLFFWVPWKKGLFDQLLFFFLL